MDWIYNKFCPDNVTISRDQSRYAPSRWETSLHCNDISHWLGAYLLVDWSLHQLKMLISISNIPTFHTNQNVAGLILCNKIKLFKFLHVIINVSFHKLRARLRWLHCASNGRDHFVNVPSQWETMLQCNVISHWHRTFTKWSLNGVIAPVMELPQSCTEPSISCFTDQNFFF